ncbi:MAG: hypothetical protein GY719_22740 [bacterium]|nr:hypothetical protein [bacterium]
MNDQKAPGKAETRKAYTRPQLITYGDIREITQAEVGNTMTDGSGAFKTNFMF